MMLLLVGIGCWLLVIDSCIADRFMLCVAVLWSVALRVVLLLGGVGCCCCVSCFVVRICVVVINCTLCDVWLFRYGSRCADMCCVVFHGIMIVSCWCVLLCALLMLVGISLDQLILSIVKFVCCSLLLCCADACSVARAVVMSWGVCCSVVFYCVCAMVVRCYACIALIGADSAAMMCSMFTVVRVGLNCCDLFVRRWLACFVLCCFVLMWCVYVWMMCFGGDCCLCALFSVVVCCVVVVCVDMRCLNDACSRVARCYLNCCVVRICLECDVRCALLFVFCVFVMCIC